MASPWMLPFLGASSTLDVQFAWGADLMADPTTWAWTSVQTDIRQDPGIAVTLGRGDEASTTQPAACSFTLDNRSGDYSLGGQSANWPNVRKGTPVRVKISVAGATAEILYQGSVSSFAPGWDFHSVPVVAVEGSGTLRRLGQGAPVVESAHLRGTRDIATVLHYWPMEEGPLADHFEPAVGTTTLQWVGDDATFGLGSPTLANDTAFATSAPLPTLKGSLLLGYVSPYPASTTFGATMLAHWPGQAGSAQGVVIGLQTTGTARFVNLTYETDGSTQVDVFNAAGTLIVSSSPLAATLNTDPRTVRHHLQLTQAGADVTIAFGVARTDDSAVASTVTALGNTFGVVQRVFVNSTPRTGPAGALDDVAVGHLVLRTDVPSFFTEIDLVSGHNGETATERVARLCDENSETVDITHSSLTTLGPQRVDTLLALLREAEAADQGILYDGVSPGLTYAPREDHENRPADLTITATSSQLKGTVAPVDNDQRTRNKATVTRSGASPSTYADETGPLGTEVIGTYETSATVNVKDDLSALHYAEWLVHLGTQEGYRYPSLSLDLGASPSLAPAVLALQPGMRIDVVGLDSALSAHPGPSTLSLLLEGVTHQLSSLSWTAELQCSLYEPWRTGVLSTGVPSPIVVIETAVPGIGDNASVTATVPDSTRYLADDLLVIVAAIRNSGTGTVDTPSGWTVLKSSGNLSVFGKLADYGEDDVTVTFTGGAAGATTIAQMFAIRGTKAHRVTTLTDVIHTSAAQLNGSAANIAYPGLTITEANCIVVEVGWKQDDWTGVAAIAGQTEILDSPTTTGSDAGIVADYVVQSTATNLAAGSFVVTGGAGAISRGISLALLPDPTPPEVITLDTDDSELGTTFVGGATSISVTTNSGPLWTTSSVDFPYDLDIGGIKYTVTACADATSPQTMTISAASTGRTAGVPVKLWAPPVLSR